MRVFLVINSLNAGGAERVLSDLANYFISQDLEVSIINFQTHDHKAFYDLDKKIKIIYLKKSWMKKGSFFIKFFSRFYCFYNLRKILKFEKPDQIISFIDLTNIITLICSYGLKIPVIVSERIDPNFHKIGFFYNWLRLKIYPLAKFLVVQTASSASYFPKSFKKNIKIIPNFVKRQNSSIEVIKDNVCKLVSVGRLDEQKDHIALIKAFKILSDKYPKLKLDIYGNGVMKEVLIKNLQDLDLDEKITIKNPTTEIINQLCCYDIFVFPSLYEGFPNALCEAMAVGLPVVASNCSGNVDVVKDGINGKLFPIGDFKKLAITLDDLIKDFDQRSFLSANAKKIVDDFDQEKICQIWKSILISND
jgi:GalNAc-alpha-(1->4)-GalNAc-alpha-(1->3)-diNAcBac-PP-undecaprenol alpha-1,4-N-acetyl-D-galactosaminyltransferase